MFWRRPIGLLIAIAIGLQSADARSLPFDDRFHAPRAANQSAPLCEALSLRSACAHLGAPSLALGHVLRRLVSTDWRARLRSDDRFREGLQIFTTIVMAAASGGAVLMARVPEQSYLMQLRTLLIELGDVSEVPMSNRARRAADLVRAAPSLEEMVAEFGTTRGNVAEGVKEAIRTLKQERDVRRREASAMRVVVPSVVTRPLADLRLKRSVQGKLQNILRIRTIGDLVKRTKTDLVFGPLRIGRSTIEHIKDRLWKTGQLTLQPSPPSPRELRLRARKRHSFACFRYWV